MKKIWSYIAMFFIGLSAGLVAMYKLTGDTFKIEVKKIKNKRVGSSEITIPINADSARNGLKPAKSERKQAKIRAKNEKKAEKARKRLEKNS